jgi:hypothetical protein
MCNHQWQDSLQISLNTAKGGQKKMESTEQKQKSLDSWDGFTGSQNFLKADMIESDSQGLECREVELEEDAERPRLILALGDEELLFDLNVTNAIYLKENGINKPSELKGKKIYFRKVTLSLQRQRKKLNL